MIGRPARSSHASLVRRDVHGPIDAHDAHAGAPPPVPARGLVLTGSLMVGGLLQACGSARHRRTRRRPPRSPPKHRSRPPRRHHRSGPPSPRRPAPRRRPWPPRSRRRHPPLPPGRPRPPTGRCRQRQAGRRPHRRRHRRGGQPGSALAERAGPSAAHPEHLQLPGPDKDLRIQPDLAEKWEISPTARPTPSRCARA